MPLLWKPESWSQRLAELEARSGDLKEEEDRLQSTVLGISTMPVEQAYQLSRAFAFYFELINLAETNHRKRRRLSLQLSGDSARQRGSLRGTLREMKRVGLSAAEALDWLGRIFIVP